MTARRRMTVVRTPGTDRTPMVKIANQLLSAMGFAIGVPIEVVYSQNLITLRTLNYEHQLQKPSSPVALSAASGATDAREESKHAGREESNPTDTAKVVPKPVQPLRYVLSGQWYHVGPQDPRINCREVRAILKG